MAKVVITFVHSQLSKCLVKVLVLQGLLELGASLDSSPHGLGGLPIILILFFLNLFLFTRSVDFAVQNLHESRLFRIRPILEVTGEVLRFEV